MIIDAHTHVWPDSVAARALAGNVKGLSHCGDGTVNGLRSAMAAAGVDRSITLGVANEGAAVEKVARFSSSIAGPDLVPFGAIHPDLSPDQNVATLREHGLVGIKVHPLFQGFRLDDKRLPSVLDALEPGTVVIVHVGGGGADELNAGCTPWMMRDLAREVTHLNFVACHFGGYRQFETALDVICGEPIYVDTSWPPSVGTLDPELVRRFIGRHGADRVVFASDWPTADPRVEIDAIAALGLGEQETSAILGGTMAGLLSRPDK